MTWNSNLLDRARSRSRARAPPQHPPGEENGGKMVLTPSVPCHDTLTRAHDGQTARAQDSHALEESQAYCHENKKVNPAFEQDGGEYYGGGD